LSRVTPPFPAFFKKSLPFGRRCCILTFLEKRGYLERIRGAKNKCVIRVHLTQAGRALYEEDTRQLTQLITKATALATTYAER